MTCRADGQKEVRQGSVLQRPAVIGRLALITAELGAKHAIKRNKPSHIGKAWQAARTQSTRQD